MTISWLIQAADTDGAVVASFSGNGPRARHNAELVAEAVNVYTGPRDEIARLRARVLAVASRPGEVDHIADTAEEFAALEVEAAA